VKIIRSASLVPLRRKSIGILGYGAQGQAQALNLRDAGFRPLIGLPPRSASRRAARRDRFTAQTPAEIVKICDVVFVLAPDHLHGKLYVASIAPHLRSGQLLAFAHASSVHFGLVDPPRDVDVVLIAPLGPGRRLRELRGRRDGVPCFVATHQDASGHARALMLALARGIGCLPAGAIETTFADEAKGDLFGEQAVLCGGLSALLEAGVETLVRHGLRPEIAYLECVYQLDLIVDLIKSEGLRGMFSRISPTAAYGARLAGPRIVTAQTRRAMDRLYAEIASGQFMRDWVKAASRPGGAKRRAPLGAVYRRGEERVLRAFRAGRATD
jgi:ketol-acid reductoisomerase